MSYRITILFSLAFLVGLDSCGQVKPDKNPIVVTDNYKPLITSAELSDKLDIAFNENSPGKLEQLFFDWNKNVKPNSIEFIEQNDTTKAVFDAFKEFYNPLDLLKLGQWEWENKLNSGSRYVAVQNKIFYAVLSSDNFEEFNWQTSPRDSIINFRPPINLSSKKVVYLTKEYEEAINQYLGTESTKMGEPNIMNPSRPAGESKDRYDMLRPYLPILHGHWGGYWHIETHPFVSFVVFNKDLTVARFTFRVGYEGGEATLVRSSSGWRIKESRSTWIE